MEDYCKQDKEVNVVSSEDWMGSSVDPPCFGQSMILISHAWFETGLTYTGICLMYYKHKCLVFTAYSELLEINGKKGKNALFWLTAFSSLKTKKLFWLLSWEWELGTAGSASWFCHTSVSDCPVRDEIRVLSLCAVQVRVIFSSLYCQRPKWLFLWKVLFFVKQFCK